MFFEYLPVKWWLKLNIWGHALYIIRIVWSVSTIVNHDCIRVPVETANLRCRTRRGQHTRTLFESRSKSIAIFVSAPFGPIDCDRQVHSVDLVAACMA